MRIAFVVHTFFPNWQAGTEVYARSLARQAVENGNEAFIVCYEPPAEGEAIEGIRVSDTMYEGLPVRRISFLKQHRFFHLRDYFYLQIQDHLVQYFAAIQPDVVHVVHAMHLSTASIWAAKKLHLPVVATATDFWYTCPTYQLVKWDESLCSGPAPLMCLACLNAEPSGRQIRGLCRRERLARILSPVFVLLAYFPICRSDSMVSLIWLSGRESWMKKTLSQVDVLLIPTANTGRVLLGNGLKPQAIENSGFGLETSAFSNARRAPRTAVLRVGYVGTFRHSKGLHVLIEAMRQMSADPVHLDVYGGAGHFPEYDTWVSSLAAGLKNVEFRGTFPNEKLAEVYGGFDVLVIPALWHENSPLVLLSAFALKIPVIASRVGSLADLVEHEKSGMLFEMGNADDLAAKLRRLLGEPELLERLRAGIPTVKTIDQNIHELLNIYAGLIGDRERLKRSRARLMEQLGSRPLVPLWWGSLFRSIRLVAFGAQFGTGLALLKCHIQSDQSGEVRFDFQWHSREFSPDWMVFIHFVDEKGETQAQGDHQLGRRDEDPWGYIAYQFKAVISNSHVGRTFGVRLGVWSPNTKTRLPVSRARGLAIDSRECAVRLGSVQIR